jgi:colanic acid/amylovoran biosynthesis glycosyltransferase
MHTVRVGYLVSKYPDVSHTFILREVMALRARGMEVSVASINGPTALTDVERLEAEKTFYVKRAGAKGALKALGSLLSTEPIGVLRGLVFGLEMGGDDLRRMVLGVFYFVEALILLCWMREKRLTHVHVHFATPAAAVAAIATRIATSTSPVTMSMTVHGPDEFYDVTAYALAAKVAASRFVVCISFFAQSQMMKIATPGGADWGKFEIGRLGVDVDHFAARGARAGDGVFRVLCVGRLVAAKGQSILIEAVEMLRKEGRPVELDLVGDGPDRSMLEAFVNTRGLGAGVRFAGSVGQDRIRDFYGAADCFAMASFAEGIPVVLMEAMAMEIPVVATGINGIPELIRDGVDGLLVAPSDVLGMAGALMRLMDDGDLRAGLGAAGRRKVMAEYRLAESADRLLDIFRRRLG